MVVSKSSASGILLGRVSGGATLQPPNEGAMYFLRSVFFSGVAVA